MPKDCGQRLGIFQHHQNNIKQIVASSCAQVNFTHTLDCSWYILIIDWEKAIPSVAVISTSTITARRSITAKSSTTSSSSSSSSTTAITAALTSALTTCFKTISSPVAYSFSSKYKEGPIPQAKTYLLYHSGNIRSPRVSYHRSWPIQQQVPVIWVLIWPDIINNHIVTYTFLVNALDSILSITFIIIFYKTKAWIKCK